MFALFNLSSKWTFNVQDLLTLWGVLEQVLHDSVSTVIISFTFSSLFKTLDLEQLTWNNLTSFQKFKLNFSCTFLRLLLKQDLDKNSQIKPEDQL